MGLADWKRLYRLARNRLSSEEAYRDFQQFQGRLLVRFLRSRGIEVAGRCVADIGCGYGGYSLALQAAGARVVALDLFVPGGSTATGGPKAVSFVMGDAVAVPLRSESFDLIVCTSLIEHIPRPERLLAELYRLVRRGGIAYVSFPPFYSPRGGHQFSPFHYLGERAAVRLARRFGRWQDSELVRQAQVGAPESFGTAWGSWGLYVLTIGKFERLLRDTAFVVRERSTRLSPFDLSGFPVLRELLTWHVQYLLERPADG